MIRQPVADDVRGDHQGRLVSGTQHRNRTRSRHHCTEDAKRQCFVVDRPARRRRNTPADALQRQAAPKTKECR